MQFFTFAFNVECTVTEVDKRNVCKDLRTQLTKLKRTELNAHLQRCLYKK